MRFLKDPLMIFLAFGLLVFVGERLLGDADTEADFLIEALQPIVGSKLRSEEGSAKDPLAITLAT